MCLCFWMNSINYLQGDDHRYFRIWILLQWVHSSDWCLVRGVPYCLPSWVYDSLILRILSFPAQPCFDSKAISSLVSFHQPVLRVNNIEKNTLILYFSLSLCSQKVILYPSNVRFPMDCNSSKSISFPL